MDLNTRTLLLCLAFALTRAAPLQDSATDDGLPDRCSGIEFDAIAPDDKGNTFFFKGNYLWKGFNGPAQLSNEYFKNLIGQVDAGFRMHSTDNPDDHDHVYLFVDDKVYSYFNQTLEEGYPKGIQEDFAGVPTHLDAAVECPKGECMTDSVLFFKGQDVHVYDIATKSVKTKTWAQLPACTSVFRWLEHYYCFHGHQFTRFNPVSGEVNGSYPKDARSYFMRCPNFGHGGDYKGRKCSDVKLDAITTDDGGRTYFFAGPIYMRLDTRRDGLHAFPITRTWKEVTNGVDAVFSYTDKIYMIKENQVYIYKAGAHFTLIEGYPKTVEEELGFQGKVDAAFVCPNEHTVRVIQGNQMRSVDLTATPRVVTQEVPLPVSGIDAGLCGSEGIKLFKGPQYYQYDSPMILAMGRIAVQLQKISAEMMGYDGQYKQKQFHGSTGNSWCVDTQGREIPGTRTGPGKDSVDCSKLDDRHCERHRNSLEGTAPGGAPAPGSYIPQCDENGQYQQKQCHGSTGNCWCVDHLGQEKEGTRTLPGAPAVDCSKQDGRVCHHHRDGVKTVSDDGAPVVGAYVPQCHEEGHYLPKQCHGSTGYCWCVGRDGKEIPGTKTPPGKPSVDCDKLDELKGHCKRHRDTASGDQDGATQVGGYVPQCDENDEYTPKQCHASTGHCWCVDRRGRERPGTKIPPGTPAIDCTKAGPVFLRLDTSQGLRSLPVTRAWVDLGDRVDAAYTHTDKIYLIKGDQVYAYQVEAPHAPVDGYPKTVKEELGLQGHVDAAFMCPDEQILHVIRGGRMFDVDLTAATREVNKQLPIPLKDIDAAFCDRDGVKLFRRSIYYKYFSAMDLVTSRVAVTPLKITSEILECED
ncbi:unnamed protein product [Menidia menidia]|uniref:Hemopexin n=1 Tax=Menidia menidia TaxID=238744 RepID=A0A8S4B675_9TELE|nr:unnamed protein product [Menidia menidia]